MPKIRFPGWPPPNDPPFPKCEWDTETDRVVVTLDNDVTAEFSLPAGFVIVGEE